MEHFRAEAQRRATDNAALEGRLQAATADAKKANELFRQTLAVKLQYEQLIAALNREPTLSKAIQNVLH